MAAQDINALVHIKDENGNVNNIYPATKIENVEGLQTALNAVTNGLAGKVDIVSGKGLSTEDFTTAEKSKLANSQKTYVSVTAMKSDSNLTVGENVRTLGYYNANDGGGALYKIRAKTESDVENYGNLHIIGDLVAEICEDTNNVNVLQHGCKGDDTFDNAAILNSITSNVDVRGMYIPEGTYFVSAPIEIGNSFTITGDGFHASIIRGTGSYVLRKSVTRNYRVQLKGIGFVGNDSNIGVSCALGYSKVSEVSFKNFATAFEAVYGSWITEIRDVDIRDCTNGFVCANEFNAVDMCNLSMEDISGIAIDLNGGRNINIRNSRFERCATVVKSTGSATALNIHDNYYEGNTYTYYSGRANYLGDTTIANNYYIDAGNNNGFMCIITTINSTDVQGGKIRILNNSIVKKTGITDAQSKPIAFVEYTGEEQGTRYCDQSIDFIGNYFDKGDADFGCFLDLIDFTNCEIFLTVGNRNIINTDFELYKWDEQPQLRFTILPCNLHNLYGRDQRYKISGYLSVANITGEQNYAVSLPDRRIMPYQAAYATFTVVYSDNTVAMVRGAINDKIYIYGIDPAKELTRVFINTEYDMNMQRTTPVS